MVRGRLGYRGFGRFSGSGEADSGRQGEPAREGAEDIDEEDGMGEGERVGILVNLRIRLLRDSSVFLEIVGFDLSVVFECEVSSGAEEGNQSG